MPKAKTISMKDFAKELGAYPKAHKKEVIGAFKRGLEKSIEPMKNRSPQDTGEMADSWELESGEDDSLLFGNTADHAVNVEYGMSRGHKVPIKPLLQWAARKLGQHIGSPEVRRVAEGVQKKIQDEGIEPKMILERGIDEVFLPRISKELDKL